MMGDMKDINYTSTTANTGLNELLDTSSTVSEWKCYDSYRYCTNGTHITIEEEEDNVAFWQIPQLIFLSVMLLFIVAGNSCLLAAINLSENGRKTRMNFFIMNLAIADLLVGLFHVSADIAEKSVITFHAGPAVCKIVKFLQATVVYASTFVLVSLSIDRVDAIARPMNFARRAMTVRTLICTAWALSALFALPSLVLFDVSVDGGPLCTMPHLTNDWHWQLYLTLVTLTAFILPAFIITICYTVIIYVIWNNGRGRSDTPNTLNNDNIRTQGSGTLLRNNIKSVGHGVIPQAKIRTIKMTLIIVIVFVLCWCPYFLFNLLDVYLFHDKKTYTFRALRALAQSLAPLNSAANPIIYGIFSTRICRNLRRIPLINCLAKITCNCTIYSSSRAKLQYISSTEHTQLTVEATRGVRIFNKKHKHKMNEKEYQSDMTNKSSYPADDRAIPNGKKNGACTKLQQRRPSGIPLIRQSMSEQDCILLKTYAVKCDIHTTSINHVGVKLCNTSATNSKDNSAYIDNVKEISIHVS